MGVITYAHNLCINVLLCAKDSVACIAETGHDISMLVEMVVNCRNINVNIGMILHYFFDTLRRSDKANELYLVCASVLYELNCGGRTSTR